jgi:outer membrane protein assembly factor BamB
VLFTAAIGLAIFAINHGHVGGQNSHASNGDVAWPIYDGGGDSPGANYQETIVNASNVHSLTKLWQASTINAADSAIVEQPNVATAQGSMDLVFVNTIYGNLIAYNAATGAKIWEADPSSANFNGQGTKSSPAVDPSGNFIYAYALDGYVHKYNITNGAEVTGTGFPAQVTILANDIEKGSSSINIGNGYLYMTMSGNDGDYGHYTGHVVAVNLATGTKTVWNAECSNITTLLGTDSTKANYCSDIMSGIWARPGVKIDPVTHNVFVATGNGLYNANAGGHGWGDSIIELKPDLSQIVDSYTPATFTNLDNADADLGSTAPVLLPTQASSNTPYMLVQSGKDDVVRLLNRANLSGSGGPGHTGGELQTITINNQVREQPATWTDPSGNVWVYVTSASSTLYAYKLVTANGVSTLVQQYSKSSIASSSPFVANGVLYFSGSNIKALDPATGASLFNSSTISISLNQHWESPVVVNGILFTPDYNGNLYALSVPGASPSPSPTATTTPTPTGSPTPAPTGKVGDLNNDGQVNIFDLSVLLSAWNTANPSADLNNDGTVNIFDLSSLLSHWGT